MKHETRTTPTLKIWRPKKNINRWMGENRIFNFTTGFKDGKAVFAFMGCSIQVPAHYFVQHYEMAPRTVWN